MGAQNTATLSFGAFPGKADAAVAITGQAAIVSGSLVEAWLYPTATADHSADEHMLEKIKVVAGNIVAGTGFTIYGFSANDISEPLVAPGTGRRHAAHTTIGNNFKGPGDQTPSVGGKMPMVYGDWTVAWVWN